MLQMRYIKYYVSYCVDLAENNIILYVVLWRSYSKTQSNDCLLEFKACNVWQSQF